MPLKVIRRPYTACAYRWALSTSGISVGEGDCSEAQCLDLNGDFSLDFSACDSKGGKLVWAGECELSGGTGGTGGDADSGCGRYRIDVSGVSGFDCAETYNGSFITRAYHPDQTCGFCLYVTPRKSVSDYFAKGSPPCDCFAPANDVPYIDLGPIAGYDFTGSVYSFFDDAAGPCFFDGLVDPISTQLIVGGVFVRNAKYRRPYGAFGTTAGDVITFTLESAECGTWPATITATRLDSTGGGTSSSTGPETNDRIRSKWHLDYDIEAQLWTLRSFERVDYPVYTLSDASPCDGDTKTLLLADKGDAADGCGVAPAEMTITRVCPPDRVGKSALLEDRKPNGATGKRKRQCGCDCLDEVDDRRHTCETKCASAATEGCERIDPAPDDITCRYPEAINCCEPTAGKDVPCAYTVEFECDLFFDIEDVRHKIAAKQVTLRRECYFEDPCLFVAAGPESSTGGSPVMDVDGYPGAQPVCASCSEPCLTGCTWDAWTVAACPNPDLCNIVAPVSKTNCLEFRWVGVLATGFVVGDVAAVLHFVSETVGSFGSVLWRFESDDGEWISNIRPNYIIACDQSQRGCGWGDLVWSNPPVDFGLSFWISHNDSATNQCFGIGQPELLFDFPQFGVAQTTLKLNWIACP